MHCGKEISDNAAFCQYCGKRLAVSKADADPPKGWEYLTFILHYRRGEGGWVAQTSYPAPVAQQNFWNDNTPIINEIRTMMTDNGWQPVGEHGPACIELESYQSAEGNNAVGDTVDAVRSFGVSLLFNKTWKFTVKSITLKWRRPRVEEGTSEEVFHMWFNIKTGELERWEIDKTTNKWVLMDMDEEGNWIRKQQ
jgi:hypothetical protein